MLCHPHVNQLARSNEQCKGYVMKIFDTEQRNKIQVIRLKEGEVFRASAAGPLFMKMRLIGGMNSVDLSSGVPLYIFPGAFVLFYPNAEVQLNASSSS